MGLFLKNSNMMRSALHLVFILTHFSTCGGVWPQAFSSQDVAMNYVLHKGEIHQVGPITNEKKEFH